MDEREVRDQLRQLADWRSNRLNSLQRAMQAVNDEFDRRAIELHRQLPKTPAAHPHLPPERKPREAPKPGVIDQINAWNREHGLPEIH